jgi:tRNA-specific 2-thiouridylase
MAKRVLLAMSGGVDSSVAAYLLKQQGYEVIGLFMRTGVHADKTHTSGHKRGCCSAEDAGDARHVADLLDIPFYAVDFEQEFGQIMDYFTDEYLAGRTPNPCVVCNNWLKFGKLWVYGQQMDADYVATGHYARIKPGADGPQLHSAVDPAKDQSYVLAGIGRQLLERILFPIGELSKDRVRQFARLAGLQVAEKPDSVEICFVPDGDHGSFIRRRRPQERVPGNIVDPMGKVLAKHAGIENFTIGQRKGLGFAAGSRRYVLSIVPHDNTVVVGNKEDLLSPGLIASRVNWLCEPPAGALRCLAKIRYRHAASLAVVTPGDDDTVRVAFDEPQTAITPGQAVAFYDGSRVLGGGWIHRAE